MNLQDIEIAEAIAAGETTRQIAAVTGLHHSTIARKAHSKDIRAFIEAINERVINESLPVAVSNIQYAINEYQKKEAKEDPQLRDHGFKASTRIMESVGLLPAHAPSTLIQNIYNDNRTQVVAPILETVLGRYLPDQAQAPVIDAQYEIAEED